MIEQWLRLLYTKEASLAQKQFLLSRLGCPEEIFRSSPALLSELLEEYGGRRFNPQVFTRAGSTAFCDLVDRDIRTLQHYNAGFLPCTSEIYPALLNTIDTAPLGLFYAGNPEILSQPQIAMVGSRHASRGGCDTAQQFASVFCNNGFAVTSGLALGIDTAAHQGALDADGLTVAVIATGIDQIYPARNQALHRAIVERGIVVSEFPPQTPPRKNQFPSRNRIISGLSQATLVVEAGIRSGSLITARLAAEQGRDVFAIPGSIHLPGSKGCHTLLKQGAGIAESPEDLLIELDAIEKIASNASFQQQLRTTDLNSEQQRLFDLLDYTPCHVDELIAHSGLTADQVSSILVQLELHGMVTELIGGYQRLPQPTEPLKN